MKKLVGFYQVSAGYLVLRINHKDEYVVHFINKSVVEEYQDSTEKDLMTILAEASGESGDYCRDKRAGVIAFTKRLLICVGVH